MNSETRTVGAATDWATGLPPRLLWDVDNVNRIDDLVEDFLDNAFGAGKEPMRAFYHLLNRDTTRCVPARMSSPACTATSPRRVRSRTTRRSGRDWTT